MIKSYRIFSLIILFILSSCGTIYIPQILPEARGVGKSIGQEDLSVKIVPITTASLLSSNNQPYLQRVIDASNLNEPAKLVSVEDAIAQKLPPPTAKESYRLGVGDKLAITQQINEFVNRQADEDTKNTKSITSRSLTIADDGFVAVLGIGRLQLEGLTQFQAEDLIYQTLVRNEENPEFELQISEFLSKQIYVVPDGGIGGAEEGRVGRAFPFTNTENYLHQILMELNSTSKNGEDSLVILKRGKDRYRVSLKKALSGEIDQIRILAEDRIIVERLPYRPERAIIVGEVQQEKLVPISAERRQSLAEALYSGGTIVLGNSDTSQIFVIRELSGSDIVAYHLDSSNPARLTLAAKFELRPNDIIYVAPQFVTNYNRALIKIFSAYDITTQLF